MTSGENMPKLRGRINFPKPYRGIWRIESPPGAKAFEQSFDNVTSLDTTVEVVGYSVYMLVNGGIRSGVGAVGGVGATVSLATQKVYVISTRGSYTELKNNPRERPIVSVASSSQISYWNKIGAVSIVNTTSGSQISYWNKIKTVVSVSVS
jgi:hypothetical protein